VVRDAFNVDEEGDLVLATDPFSLADPAAVTEIMTTAGFTDVDLADVQEPVYYGADTGAAFDAVLSLRTAKDLLPSLDADEAAAALDRLRASIDACQTRHGVYFDSASWLITAHRP
jgi:hypothetical protein